MSTYIRYVNLIAAAVLLRVDGKNDHQCAQGVLGIVHIDGIGVRPVEQFLTDGGDGAAAGALDGVLPLHEISLCLPTVTVDLISGDKKAEGLLDTAYILLSKIQFKPRKKGEHLLLHRTDMVSVSVQNVEAMAPGQLSLHGVGNAAVLIVNIITVKPGKKALFEKHGYATSFVPNEFILTPPMFNNIYKGALGEVVGKYILEQYAGVTLQEIPPEHFELFDYPRGNGVYVDFKLWKETMTVSAEEEKKNIMARIEKQKFTIQRSKGLGENEPEMMWITTMNPETRRLIKVCREDVARTQEMFELLLGDNLAGRKQYIQDFGADYLDQLDLS